MQIMNKFHSHEWINNLDYHQMKNYAIIQKIHKDNLSEWALILFKEELILFQND